MEIEAVGGCELALCECVGMKVFLLTVGPFVDGVIVRRGHVRVGVFPVEVHGILQIDKHSVRDSSFAPAVATDTSMAIEILPFFLVVPLFISIPPTILFESRVVGSVPQVHSYKPSLA